MIRRLTVEDAEQHLNLMLALDEQTGTMLYEPGERSDDAGQHAKRLAAALNSTLFIWVWEENGTLTGHVTVIPGQLKRTSHKASIVIGLLPSHQNKGLGSRLMDTAIHFCRERSFKRLELTVMTHNEAAVSLYKKKRFLIEGTIRASLTADGEPVDEYIMGRLL
ncbi:GNAT family N-acetyltransferase [Bacillus mangrovi]|uniref:GNAT family N-acetyltransferase n=1 Tax=Metabacillus mangrovi TaxID=1491830 RepID=A0A7X2S4M9_9BACI|nr:GNAT family N-acetyltransferase [Metabacillus mangrovi]MTH53168.1 GNAT family N-acetyltransferase [Metabacillus mangrovi]